MIIMEKKMETTLIIGGLTSFTAQGRCVCAELGVADQSGLAE